MLIPDEQDIPLINLLSGDFKGRKYHLFENPSPVLPLHFDKKYLPSRHLLRKKIFAKDST